MNWLCSPARAIIFNIVISGVHLEMSVAGSTGLDQDLFDISELIMVLSSQFSRA